MSRRSADKAIELGRVKVNGKPADPGVQITASDVVELDGVRLDYVADTMTIMFHKPVGYICSRDGQGSRTIYDVLPANFHHLNPVGRLDKDSSGLLLMTNDGRLTEELTHPKYQKTKVYEVKLNHALPSLTRQIIADHGVMLEDGRSQFQLERIVDGDDTTWRITMAEGRNRQIRRTFSALGFTVTKLHRTYFGQYALGALPEGDCKIVA